MPDLNNIGIPCFADGALQTTVEVVENVPRRALAPVILMQAQSVAAFIALAEFPGAGGERVFERMQDVLARRRARVFGEFGAGIVVSHAGENVHDMFLASIGVWGVIHGINVRATMTHFRSF